MRILERELRERLLGDDDGVVRSTLRRFFRPQPRFTAPLLWDWMPLPDLQVVLGDTPGDSAVEMSSERVIDLANVADALWRRRRYERRAKQHPELPVVVCEGDSWISHPFIDDIGDHLFDDGAHTFNVLNHGSAGDRLQTVAEEREHEVALARLRREGTTVAAVLLSGGGNDLLLHFHEFLHRRPHPTGTEPARLVTAALEVRLDELMALIGGILRGVRAQDPSVPILMHGYDYLRVAEPEQGKFLAPHFDEAGIEESAERQATLEVIVDRFNEHLARTIAEVPGAEYLDLRGTVPIGRWYDEIHPDEHGYARLTGVVGAAVRKRVRRVSNEGGDD